MIRKLKYKEIDFEKYQECIKNSEQYSVFAEKKYLDTLIGNRWDVLVCDDYQAVMPVSFVNKFGFKFVVMPFQTQQLGIFSKQDNEILNDEFLRFLQKNYNIYYYAFNHNNKFVSSLKCKFNYRLIKDNYENVRKRYSIHRRRNVRITDFLESKFTFVETKDLSNEKKFFIDNAIGASKKDFKFFFDNMIKLNAANFLKVFNLYFEDTLASQAYLVNGENEYLLVNFINNKKFLKYNSSSIILDYIFQKSISNKNFNFHGSMISSIANFYKRFGAIEEKYPIIQNSKKELVKKIFIKS